jgi:transposase InsO family protein
VKAVLERLRQHNLYAKLSKCSFHQKKVHFLGYIVGSDGVEMDPSRVDTIRTWPVPESYREIQIFLGFTGFFRRFIHQYSKITVPLTELLKGSVRGKKAGLFEFSERAKEAFESLKQAFMTPPLLIHFDPAKPILVLTDASGFAIAAILMQPKNVGTPHSRRSDWHPVAFYSQKMNETERRYEVHDQELMAIVLAFKHWRHYLEGSTHPIVVQTDHANLRYFFTTKKLNQRQARWAELLAAYDFTIEYKPGRLNAADAPTRRRDYEPSELNEFAPLGPVEDSVGLLPTLQRKLRVGAYSTRLSGEPSPTEEQSVEAPGSPEFLVPRLLAMEAASGGDAGDSTAPGMPLLLRRLQGGDAFSCEVIRNSGRPESQKRNLDAGWRVDQEGLVRHNDAIYVSHDPAVKRELLRIHHDGIYGGHLGVEKTAAALRRRYYWERMKHDVREYVKTCEVCQRIRAPRHRPYGQLSSLPIPKCPWDSVTMDFIVGLPPSTRRGVVYDAILVIVDRYTKMALYIPTHSKCDAEELADLFADHVLNRYGRPTSIVSDRGSLFTSGFWSALCDHLHIKRRLSTAYHPQTDGQTERQNQTLEQYLRAYVNFRQDNWAGLLGVAEFTYNSATHASTKLSPFYALYGYHPQPLQEDDWSTDLPNVAAEERVQELKKVRNYLEDALRHAIETQAKHYDKKHQPRKYVVGDLVMLSKKNLKSWRPSTKLDDRFDGPFEVIEVVGKQAYTIRLPKMYGNIHPTFHVSLLEPWHGRPGEIPADPKPIVVDGEEEWEVEEVLTHRIYRGKKQYLVKWKGFPSYENSWIDATEAQELEALDRYERAMNRWNPRRSYRTVKKD